MGDSERRSVGRLLLAEKGEGGVCLTLEGGRAYLRFPEEGVLHYFFDPEGKFEDAASGKILARREESLVEPELTPAEGGYTVSTPRVTLRLWSDPFRLEALRPDGGLYFSESRPLLCGGGKTVQTLRSAPDEYFYGVGMQNGYFSHKGRVIDAALRDNHWNAGSVSNPAPFYLSSRGYGMLRNTFSPGRYAFLDETELSQDSGTLDAFYFFADDLRGALDGYTRWTGRPHLIPRWGLMPGDANCYKETMDALKTVEGYEENDFPRGWILPNDGYGCGYTDLRGFIEEARKRGFRVGLWTENSVDKIAQEVRDFGSRAVKTDVAWVGPGYEFALDGVRVSNEGIENNSDARGYVWTCCGWAGTQRYSAVWSGDQFGNWEYIRMHLPTYLGSGLSGNPFCGSDVDGIFAGSAETQVRDLQWKCFSPILIFMSGWAPKNKQPWVWGEPYTSINRHYLQLRLRLIPYLYTLARRASLTGEPMARPVLWNYPGEGVYAYNKDTQYQFLLGESFLVAPVFEDRDTRDAIFLPGRDERWIDYHTGEQYAGGQVLNSFPAPLHKLPVFVRSGSVIPMYPLGRFDGDCLPDETHPLTLDIYPRGEQCFVLYEDDGSTKEYRDGAFAETAIRVSAPESGAGRLRVSIGAASGSYQGMSERRCYELAVHTHQPPQTVRAGGETLLPLDGAEAYAAAESGFYYDPSRAGGVLYVKTRAFSVREAAELEVDAVCSDPIPVPVTDAEAPAAPEGLEIEEAGDRKLVLRWNAVPGAGWYDLEADGLLYTHVSNPYPHRELECSTEYTYRVRACNTRGASAWSEALTAQTLESSLRDALSGEEDIPKVHASNERPGYGAEMAVNGDGESFWRTSEKDDHELPAVYDMELSHAFLLDRFEYKSRAKGTRGNITKYNLSLSIDGIHYKTIVSGGEWPDQDEPHKLTFPQEMARHVRIEALEGLSGSANATHFIPYRAPGTGPVLPGNYTGGDAVDDNDLTFVRNYIGVFQEDNDWGYVSKCDINYNGRIDAYDLAFVARQLDGGAAPAENTPVAGSLRAEVPQGPVKAGETFEVRIVGESLQNVYAFDMMLALDERLMEHQTCTGRCKKEVVARSGELSAGMVNACAVKSDENGAKVIVAFTARGTAQGLSGTGELAVFTLRAKRDLAAVELPVVDALLVGTGGDSLPLLP